MLGPPVAECPPSPIDFSVGEIFDRAPKSMFGHVVEVSPMFLNPLVVFTKFLEGLESRYDMGVVSIFGFGRLEWFSV